MTENNTPQPPAAPSPWAWLTEDWLATSIGIVIVLLLGLGALGAGPQEVKLSAKAGTDENAEALAHDGWGVTAKLGDDEVDVANAPTTFDEGSVYVFVCENGALRYRSADELANLDGISLAQAAPYPKPDEGNALLVVDNRCDGKVSLTFKTKAAIRWPIFDIFK